MARLIIWGAGTLGRLVGAQWHGTVIGYTQSDKRHAALQAAGIQPRIGDPSDEITAADYLLLALPGHQRQLTAVQILLANGVTAARAVVISSTGYFGQQSGRVTPHTPPGKTDRAQAIAQMERTFAHWAGANGVILRPGGLYNAERGPFQAFLRKQQLPDRPLDRTLALVHYADVATAVIQALRHPNPSPAYNIVTPPCPTRRTFYHACADHIGKTFSALAAESQTNSLVEYDVALLRQHLLPHPAYPDWQAIFGTPLC